MLPEEFAEATRLVRGGLARSPFDETAEAIYPTSGFVYRSAEEAAAAFAGEVDRYIYGRYGNPTVAMFEERLRLLEGAEVCRATASGMSAVFAALACFLGAGDRIVASRALFGSCSVIVTDILPRFGVESVLVDGRDLDQWAAALAGGASAVFLETPSNPSLEVIDLAAVSDLAHAAGALVVVDNVFATPVLQHPMRLGADVVVYSATKHIDGQGRTLGGAVLCSQAFHDDHLQDFLRHTGPSLSPFNAWVLLKGLETLRLRVDAQSAAAERLARHLVEHPAVRSVRYPFLESHPDHDVARRQMEAGGTIVCLELNGDQAHTFEVINALEIFDISNNLGDTKSLVTHPATTTHRRVAADLRAEMGITASMVRLSIGLEDPDDLIADLTAALAR
ncbi:MAG: O-succinylhomoserine sulfhydrylase [Acidimicrobiales bacterium]|nr:O-succinylhomoserine sulfhydrylase [Acidimicrobiales bacterium]